MFFLKDDRMTSYSNKLDSFPLDTSGTRPAICGMLKPLTWDCTTTPPWGGNSYEDSQAELECSTSPAVSWGSLPYILRTFRCFSLIKTWWPATRGVFKWSIYKVFYQGWRHFLSFGLRRGTRPAKPIYCLDWNLYEIYVGNNYCYYVSGLGQCYDTTPR